MRYITLFTLAAWSLFAQAQSTFEKLYFGGGAGRMELVELTSQNVMTLLSYSSTVNVTGSSIVDTAGNIVQTHCYFVDTLLVLQSVKKSLAHELIFVGGYYKDPCSTNPLATNTYPVIGRMDSMGTILDLHHYALNLPECSNLAGDLEVLSHGSVVTWGRDARFFALKVDSVGAPVWAKHFSNHGGFQFIKELPGGDLLAGINMDTAGAVVARMNADGEFVWCKSYIRPNGVVYDAVIESDTSYVIVGYTDSIASTDIFTPLPSEYHPKLYMMRMDGEGDVQWCRGYEGESQWYVRSGSRIVQSQDGNFVVLANIGVQNQNRPFRSFLMKTDLNGDTLWTRSAGANGYSYATSDLLALTNGGFMHNGIVLGDLPEGWSGAPYILRTDSLGHLPCLEKLSTVQVLDLFPADSSFLMSSAVDAVVWSAFASDANCDPIEVYDACIVTTITNPMRPRQFRVYPNPNTGHFTVEFQDPLMADSYYSVYDTMGKLLLQRAAVHGQKTEEVDLSRYGAGAYLIKFTDRDGVCYERVVVE